MGTRGPLPKPTRLKILAGNPGHRPLNLENEVSLPLKIPSAPKYLRLRAKAEWKKIAPILLEKGLVSQIDQSALALYCQAVSDLDDLEMEFNRRLAEKIKEGLSYSEALYATRHVIMSTGAERTSLICKQIKEQREQVHKYLQHFGLSPASRSRVKVDHQNKKQNKEPQGFEKFALVK